MFRRASQTLSRFFHSEIVREIGREGGPLNFSYFSLTTEQRTQKIGQVIASLPRDDDYIFRGTLGPNEIRSSLRSGYIGTRIDESRKDFNHDLVAYIRENDSCFYISTSPCRDTVRAYASGISMIPSVGYIMVMGLPKVYTVPQKHLLLLPEMFDEYDYARLAPDPGESRRYCNIIEMATQNNEVTIVIGLDERDDWRPTVRDNLHKIVQVCGPGRFLGKFMSSSQPVHVSDWTNPDFRHRTWSIEVFYHNFCEEKYRLMNDRAISMGLIDASSRLLTFQDAKVMVQSERLEACPPRNPDDRTRRFVSVPKEIAVGDQAALVEYHLYVLEQSPQNSRTEPLVPSSMAYTSASGLGR